MTQCTPTLFDFQALGNREVVAAFDGGKVTSDAGGLLLREVESKFGFIAQFARCFSDYRDPDRIEHTLDELLKQRIFGLCLGYEDLNDHDQLRNDPLLAVLVGKKDPLGSQRLCRDKGKPLAGKSTLNRLELTPVRANADSRYKKIVAHKAEHLAKGENPRFVVTSLSAVAFDAKTVYEQEYCARGNMENRIKEKKLYLFADRVSCQTMRANQVRLCLSTVAYVVMRALRQFGLKETEMAQAQCDTIRVKLLKIGATIQVTVRRVVLAMSEACPFQAVFQRAWTNLRELVAPIDPLGSPQPAPSSA